MRHLRGAVLSVCVDERKLAVDRRAYDILNTGRRMKRLPPVQPPKDWRRSVDEIGSVVYLGAVSRDRIELVEFVPQSIRRHIDDPRPFIPSLTLEPR